MRWIHIDDMLELREGDFARAVKSIPSTADYLEDHFPAFPVMPECLLIESMAQTAGILVGQSLDFKKDIILAKIVRAEFFAMARPGDRLIIEARMEKMEEEGARANCRVLCGGTEIGCSTLIFAILKEDDSRELGLRNFVFSGPILDLFKFRGKFSITDQAE
jgi:3-hydroxyacyl-[acyl-carrier-protein] dehydratase